MVPSTSKLYDAVQHGMLTHDGSAMLRRHIGNASVKEIPGGRYVLQKDHPDRKIDGAVTLADIRPRQWNHVRIIARGNRFRFFINGKPAAEFTDNAKSGRLDSGAIALQIHDKGMHVEFKDIQMKLLKSISKSTTRKKP